jgi:predicted RNA-binding protein with PIN domain
MRLIVDGMNVIGSRPDGWWRDRPAAMRRLAGDLAEHARRTGDEVVVVLDGAPLALEVDDGVEVRFAAGRGPNAADDDIAALVESDADPARLTVVTSDATLAERVRAAGGEVTGAGAFRRGLDER